MHRPFPGPLNGADRRSNRKIEQWNIRAKKPRVRERLISCAQMDKPETNRVWCVYSYLILITENRTWSINGSPVPLCVDEWLKNICGRTYELANTCGIHDLNILHQKPCSQADRVPTIRCCQPCRTRASTATTSHIRDSSLTWTRAAKVRLVAFPHSTKSTLKTFEFRNRLALLRHRRPPGKLPLSEWHPVLASRVRVRLVVQRALRPVAATVRHQRTPVPAAKSGPDATASDHHQAAGGGHFQLSRETHVHYNDAFHLYIIKKTDSYINKIHTCTYTFCFVHTHSYRILTSFQLILRSCW